MAQPILPEALAAYLKRQGFETTIEWMYHLRDLGPAAAFSDPKPKALNAETLKVFPVYQIMYHGTRSALESIIKKHGSFLEGSDRFHLRKLRDYAASGDYSGMFNSAVALGDGDVADAFLTSYFRQLAMQLPDRPKKDKPPEPKKDVTPA